MRCLILPGVGDSESAHWQTAWERSNSRFQRVRQRDFDHPVCAEWTAVLDKAVEVSGPDVILVAHSLGCLLVAHWAEETPRKIGAALLVAVPDPSGPNFPKQAIGFARVPDKRLPFPSIVVASSNDPYGPIDFAERCASSWGSRFENLGPAGHINAASKLGDWPDGFRLLQSLVRPSA